MALDLEGIAEEFRIGRTLRGDATAPQLLVIGERLLRIARAAQAVVEGVERETLVPAPLLHALRAALEGRDA